MRHRFTVPAALVVATLALAGCSSGSADDAAPSPDSSELSLDDLVAAAQDEGSLLLYGDAQEINLRNWTAGFTEEYGIPVDIQRDSAAPLFQRFSQEQAAGQQQADVLGLVDHNALDQAVDNGWLAEYTPADAGLYPADLGREGYYYPVQNGFAHTVAYNPENLTEQEIALIEDDPLGALGDPRFAGRAGVCPPQTAQLAQAFWWQYTDGAAADDYGWDALEDIAANDPVITDTVTLTQNIVQGEIDLAGPIADSLVSSTITSGAPIRFAYATPTVGSTFGMSVVENAPHPNAARLFMEWATTPEANASYSEITQTAPLNSENEDERAYIDEDWFTPQGDDTWFDFPTDEDFLAAVGPEGDFLDRWSETFGYSG